MFVEFNPFLLLLWISLICFVPGVLLSFAAFRKSQLLAVEKFFIGCAIGLVALPLIPFLLYFIIGIKFSFIIAVFSVLVFYAVALIFAYHQKLHEDVGSLEFTSEDILKFQFTTNTIISIAIILIMVVAFWIRLSSYSPIFQELDPYFYTYVAQQILVLGENPFNDQTAWYPEVQVSHRSIPELSYLESLWYSFYTLGGSYSNMLLSLIAGFYPPLMAAFAFFFLYLAVSVFYKREWALVSAGIASFIPMVILKLLAGESEVQPYAFFAMAFFFAMYFFMVKTREIKFAVLSGLAYLSLTLGSSSEVVGLSGVLLFMPVYSLYLYFKEETEEFRQFLINNSIIFVIGLLIATGLLKGFFYYNYFLLQYPIAFLMVLLFSGVLYFMRTNIAENAKRNISLGGIILAGMIAVFFTPVGNYVKSIGDVLSLATYTSPLYRTIAEQGTAGGVLESQIGFIASTYPSWAAWFFGIFSWVGNLVLYLIFVLLDIVLKTGVQFDDKGNSLLLLWIVLFMAFSLYSVIRSIMKKESPNILLFALFLFPPMLLGLLKAKYTIYTGFLLAGLIGVIFGESEELLKKIVSSGKSKDEKDENEKKEFRSYVYYGFVALGLLLIFFQFTHDSFASSLLSNSFAVRYQDNPAILKTKFQSICSDLTSQNISESALCSQYQNRGYPICGSYDVSICSVATDPSAYAQLGTNYQYSTRLCFYSIISDVTKPSPGELIAASLRCERVADYWIESMEWINTNTENDSRTTSWWDYGHWINFFGQKDTVLRNEHASHTMIGDVAHGYLEATPAELKSWMNSHDTKYALFDMELIAGGGRLGGKYGALNYLQCARNNFTTVSQSTGESKCEMDHLWEVVYMPTQPTTDQLCTISKTSNKTGIRAYLLTMTFNQSTPLMYSPYYPGVCYQSSLIQDNRYLSFCQNMVKATPRYCVGDTILASGTQTIGFYLLNETYPGGDLKLHKAIAGYSDTVGATYHFGSSALAYTLFYTTDKIWLENGTITSGYDDRTTDFYSSNLYRALFLNELPGFTQVFSSKGGQVKIYKVVE